MRLGGDDGDCEIANCGLDRMICSGVTGCSRIAASKSSGGKLLLLMLLLLLDFPDVLQFSSQLEQLIGYTGSDTINSAHHPSGRQADRQAGRLVS